MSPPVSLTSPSPPPSVPRPRLPFAAAAGLGLLVVVSFARALPSPLVAVCLIVLAAGAALELRVRGALRLRRAARADELARRRFGDEVDAALVEERADLLARMNAPATARASGSTPSTNSAAFSDPGGLTIAVGYGPVASAIRVEGRGPFVLDSAPLLAAASVLRVFAPPRLGAMLASSLAGEPDAAPSRSRARAPRAPRAPRVPPAVEVVDASLDGRALERAVPRGTLDLWVGPDGAASVRTADQCGGAWTTLDFGLGWSRPAGAPS